MRIKSLSIIAGFLVFSLAITSCLDSENNYELSSDNLITAFSLDTIYGETYKFTIDQLKGEIYNVDSVPYSADTIINRILIKTLTTNGYVTAGQNVEPFLQDTLFNYADSINFIEHDPLRIRVRSYDGLHTKEYTIKVRIHKTDPDTLVWGDNAYVANFTEGKIKNAKESKAVLLNDKILLFASYDDRIAVYRNPATSPLEETLTLPVSTKIPSIVNLNDTLYAAGGDGKIYFSVNSIDWTPATTQSETIVVENLIATFQSKDGGYISAIIKENDKQKFATAVSSAAGELTWTKGELVSGNFPSTHVVATKSYTTPTGGQQVLLIGEPAGDATATTPWFSTNGLNWGAMTPSKTKYALPVMEEPSILYYGNTIYAFGKTADEGFSGIYTSINGIIWEKIKKKFRFPLGSSGECVFKDRSGYTMAVDKDNYIWMFWNTDDEVWRGKLNRLGFEI
ncbi:MAG: DUF6242 domain-containing protein [Mediterranea sp.]|jgi:hypothetical protein|nr:DUF6242 domain-containing protein [Mediterranea sp.]